MNYNQKFFENSKMLASSSAKEIAPYLISLVHPKSVVDLGCGTGSWLAQFAKLGIKDFLGVDGEYVNVNLLEIPIEKFMTRDLDNGFKTNKKFDLVISLEVAEHLHKGSSMKFIRSLTNLGDVIVFSAAIPFQGGTHHINEQWPEYWVELFAKEGFIAIDCLRGKYWNNPHVGWWYSQNMFVFVRKNKLHYYPQLKKQYSINFGKQLSLVHPNCYLNMSTLENLKLKKFRILNKLKGNAK